MIVKVPETLNIGCHPYYIVFNKLLYDGQAFGRSSLNNEVIQLNPNNVNAQQEVTFLHEILSIIHFQLIGENMSENVACALSEGLCSVLKELNIEFSFSKIKEMTEEGI